MKFLVILIPGLVIVILSLIKKKYRMFFSLMFMLYVIGMNVYYNSQIINLIVTPVTTTNQLIYQKEYVETGEYPDALLPFLVRGKTVYVKNDPFTRADARDKHFNWAYAYYHMHNVVNTIRTMRAHVVPDESYNSTFVDAEHRKDFENIGYANDMLRNSLMYSNNYGDESGNYFYYYWYYGDQRSEMNIYVNFDGLYDADEVVLLWQLKKPSEETEDLYLMSKKYFEENFNND